MAERRTLVQWRGSKAGELGAGSATRHRVEFVWPSDEDGAGLAPGREAVALFADLLLRSGCAATLDDEADGFRHRRLWVDGPGFECVSQNGSVVVVFGGDSSPGSLRVNAQEIVWQPHFPSGPRPGADRGWRGGEGFVALGFLVRMYGQDPDVGRRLLENRLAPRGRGVVAPALRLFELGWRLGPQRAPAARKLPGRANAGGAVSRSLPLGTADSGRLGATATAAARGDRSLGFGSVGSFGPVDSGAGALMGAAVEAGLVRCLPPPLHPAVGPLLAEYRLRGGRVEAPADRDLADAGGLRSVPAGAVGAADAGPWLAFEIGGEPAEIFHTAGPQVVLRLERLPERSGPFIPGETTPLTGSASLWRPRAVVLAPTTREECRDAVARAARLAAAEGRDVAILVDFALMEAAESPSAGDGADRVCLGVFGPDVSPMNCRAFAPAALLPERTADLPDVGHFFGDEAGDLLFVGWGTTRERTEAEVLQLIRQGLRAAALHLTRLHPLCESLVPLLARFRRVAAVDRAPEGQYGPARARVRHLQTMLNGLLRLGPSRERGVEAWIAPLPRGRDKGG